MNKLKKQWPIIAVMSTLFIVMFIFLYGVISITPTNLDVSDMQFTGEMNQAVVSYDPTLSKIIFIIMMIVIFGALIFLFIYVFKLKVQADLLMLQSVIDVNPALNDEGVKLFALEGKTFIVAIRDIHDDRTALSEKRDVVDLIEDDYPVYIKTARMKAGEYNILYTVYIDGIKKVDQVRYSEMKKYLSDIPKIEKKENIEDIKEN